MSDATTTKPRRGPMHLDALSLVLQSIRLHWMIPGISEMTAPWGVRFEPPPSDLADDPVRRPGAVGHPLPMVRGAVFGILRGRCELEVPGDHIHVSMVAGDVVVINRPGPHIVRDEQRTTARHFFEMMNRDDIEAGLGLRGGGGGELTSFICGGFSFEDVDDSPLLASLPPVVHIRGQQSAGTVLESAIRSIHQELTAGQAGSHCIVNHLASVVFVYAVRGHFANLPDQGPGNWLHAMLDPDIGQILGLIHRHPERPWTVESLADCASMSRSAFAARFTQVVGDSPLQYLTNFRMRRAKELLRTGLLTIKAIAGKVGYANESSFSNAFRRHTSVAPAKFRSAARMDGRVQG